MHSHTHFIAVLYAFENKHINILFHPSDQGSGMHAHILYHKLSNTGSQMRQNTDQATAKSADSQQACQLHDHLIMQPPAMSLPQPDRVM